MRRDAIRPRYYIDPMEDGYTYVFDSQTGAWGIFDPTGSHMSGAIIEIPRIVR